MTEDDKALVEGLRAFITRPYVATGVTFPPLVSTVAGVKLYTNPDGPKAADRIEQLTAEVEHLQTKLAELNNSDVIARTMAENERKDAEIARLRELLVDAAEIIDDQLPGEFPAWRTDTRAALGKQG